MKKNEPNTGHQRAKGAQEQQQQQEQRTRIPNAPYTGGNFRAHSFARTTRHARHGHGTRNTMSRFVDNSLPTSDQRLRGPFRTFSMLLTSRHPLPRRIFLLCPRHGRLSSAIPDNSTGVAPCHRELHGVGVFRDVRAQPLTLLSALSSKCSSAATGLTPAPRNNLVRTRPAPNSRHDL